MRDTNEKIATMYNAMFARLSFEERALMGCSMHDFAKQIALSQIKTPDKSHAEIMSELFTRFYGQEFHGEYLKRVLDAVYHYHSTNTSTLDSLVTPAPE